MRVWWLAQFVGGLAVAALLGGCQIGNQEQQALELLRRARAAEQTVNLEGRVQTTLARPEGTVQGVAEVNRTPEYTVMKFVEGPIAGQEIVRQNRDLIRVKGPGARQPLAQGPELIPPVEQLEGRYEVGLGGRATIAGRPVRQVTIGPRGRWPGPQINLWVDEETGFPLGRERRDPEGRVIFATRYLEVKYGQRQAPVAPPSLAATPPAGTKPPGRPAWPSAAVRSGVHRPAASSQVPSAAPPTETTAKPDTDTSGVPPSPPGASATRPRGLRPQPPSHPGEKHAAGTGPARRFGPHTPATVEEMSETLGVPVALPAYVPEGYSLQGGFLTRPTSHRQRGILRYSDGVRFLTVIVSRRRELGQHPAPPAAAAEGGAVVIRSPRGAVALAVRGETAYVVIGQFPEETLQKIAASIP